MVNEGEDIMAIKIRLLFFGPLADSMGQREIEVALNKGTSVMQLLKRFQLSDIVNNRTKIAINSEIIDNFDFILMDSSEIAFLPPFSGG